MRGLQSRNLAIWTRSGTAEGILKSALRVDLPVGVPRSQGFGGEGDAMVIGLLSRLLPPLYPIRCFSSFDSEQGAHMLSSKSPVRFLKCGDD